MFWALAILCVIAAIFVGLVMVSVVAAWYEASRNFRG